MNFIRSGSSAMLFLAAALGAILATAYAADEVVWKTLGPGGGGAYHDGGAVHPTNPNVVIMGSDVSGVYRSADGAVTWKVANGGLTDPDLQGQVYFINDVVFDPVNPNNVYLGTGGLFKSTDGGVNWVRKLHPDWDGILSVAIDPLTPSVVYAGTGESDGRVFKSLDGWATASTTHQTCAQNPGGPCFVALPLCPATSRKGCTNPVSACLKPAVNAIVIRPQNPSQLLAATDCGLYGSDDAGLSWTFRSTPTLPYDNLRRLAMQASTPTLYVTLDTETAVAEGKVNTQNPDSWLGGVYKSTNWGVSWTEENGTDDPESLKNTGFEEVTPEVLVPNQDVSVEWTPKTAPGNFDEVDDPVSQAPDDDLTEVSVISTGPPVVRTDEYELTNTAFMDATAQTTDIWVAVRRKTETGGSNDIRQITVTLVVDGVDQGSDTQNHIANGWVTQFFSNSNWSNRNWTKSQIDTMRVKVRANLDSVGKSHQVVMRNSSVQVTVNSRRTSGFSGPLSGVSSWFPLSGSTASTTQDCTVSHSGACSIKVTSSVEAFGGVRTDFMPTTPNTYYVVSVFAKVQEGVPGQNFVTVFSRTSWYDQNKVVILWPGEPYGHVNNWTSRATSHDWRQFETLVQAPPGAAFMKIEHFGTSNQGVTWFDDASLRVAHSLPRVTGHNSSSSYVSYKDVVVDSEDANTLYVGTARSTFVSDPFVSETGGVWKSANGGATWSPVTRAFLLDNVSDGPGWTPMCGNLVCNRPDETRINCAPDCVPASEGGTSIGVANISYHVEMLEIGTGPAGHQHLYFGDLGHLYRSTDAGATWAQVVSNAVQPPTFTTSGSWTGRGETNHVFVNDVKTDAREPLRLYYGDMDNYLQVSYDGGVSFVKEGGNFQWRAQTGVLGDAPTSILLDPNNQNRIYCGVYVFQAVSPGFPNVGGVVQGDYSPASNTWSWTRLGDVNPDMLGGPVDLVMDSSGGFFAGVQGKGVFRKASGSNLWVKLVDSACSSTECTDSDPGTPCSCNWANPPGTLVPTVFNVYRLVKSPATDRLFAGVGDPRAGTPPNGRETGVWVSDNLGVSWTKISSSNAQMDKEPILELLPVDDDTLFVGTWYAYGKEPPAGSQSWTGCTQSGQPVECDGGLYKADYNPGSGTWSWGAAPLIRQPQISGIARSPFNSDLMYAFASTFSRHPSHSALRAGVYKSLDGGNTWQLLPNNGLSVLKSGRLFFSAHDPLKVYIGAQGVGTFEGTLPCNNNLFCDPGEVAGVCGDCLPGEVSDLLQPNADVSVQWTPSAGGGNFALVDEGVPTADDDATEVNVTSTGPLVVLTDEYELEAPVNMALDGLSTTISVTIRRKTELGGSNDIRQIRVALVVDGVEQTAAIQNHIANGWVTQIFLETSWNNRNWTRTQIENMKVRVRSFLDSVGKSHTVNMRVSAVDVLVNSVAP